MFRYAIYASFMALYPSPVPAESVIPPWCCPSTCEILDRNAEAGQSAQDTAASILRRYETTFPFARDFFRGNAPDGVTRICFGFDSFGSPEIKCIFSPLPLI